MPGLAVGGDRGETHRAVLVADLVRLLEHRRALGPGVRDALVDVGHLQRDVDDAVAVPAVVVDERAVRIHRTLDDEPHRTAPQDVGVVVAVAGGGTGVGDQFHSERGLVVVRGLRGVTHHPHHRVPAADGERVPIGVVLDEADELPQFLGVQLGELLAVGKGELESHGDSSCRRTRRHRCVVCHQEKPVARTAQSPLFSWPT